MRARLAILCLVLLGLAVPYGRAQAPDPSEYLNRGHVLSKTGKPEQALPYYLLALELGEQRFGTDSPALAPLLEMLGEAHNVLGHMRDAEAVYRRALDLRERNLAQQQEGIAGTLHALASIYEAGGRAAEAEAMHRRVVELEPVLGAAHASVRLARARLAELAPPPEPVLAAAPDEKPREVEAAEVKPAAAEATPPPPEATPPPAEADPAAAALPAAAPGPIPWRIHLTSVRKRADAEAEWARLQRLHRNLLRGLELTVRRADLGPPRGTYYRIQAGPLSEAAALTLCAAFGGRGQWCGLVPGKAAPPAEAPTVAALPQSAVNGIAPAEAADHRVHLASVRHAEEAPSEWARLRRLYPELLSDLRLSVERVDLGPPRGAWYRVLGGPLEPETARAVCRELAKRGAWCGTVRPTRSAADGVRTQLVRRVRGGGGGSPAGTRRPRLRARRTRAVEPGCRRFPAPVVQPASARSRSSSRSWPQYSSPSRT